jgi:hypothetical protein
LNIGGALGIDSDEGMLDSRSQFVAEGKAEDHCRDQRGGDFDDGKAEVLDVGEKGFLHIAAITKFKQALEQHGD